MSRSARKMMSASINYDWSETNVPWAYVSPTQFTQDWPGGISIVDIQTASGDFYTNLYNTANSAPGRVVVRLGAGVYHLNQFRLIGSSGSQTYSFGFWHPKLQGLLGQGADKTFIQMDADSMTQAQLDALAVMDKASFAPNQMGIMRIDGSDVSPVLISGVTFRAEDQQMLTATASDTGIVVPQPAPHHGLVIYSGSSALISYVRFQGAGRACMSQPPFEHGNVGSQYADYIVYKNCEFDGRRSPDLDPARPRRCGPIMLNNETLATLQDCWIHHTNLSRYAVNDQNRETQGAYNLIRVKAEQITNVHNVDPALNGGASLGGYTNASLFGWESCNGTVTIQDCMMSQDDPYTDVQIAQHLQFTSVGARNPQGGRLTVRGGVFHNTAWPQLEGILSIRAIPGTYWVSDGYNTTMSIYTRDGTRLSPYVYSGSWPPSSATLQGAGVSAATHYLIRNS